MPSESLAVVRVGAGVVFAVRGYPGQVFAGRVERVSPIADPVTRQVPIWVTVEDRSGRLVAGLFADGRLTPAARRGLIVPTSVIADLGTSPSVLLIRGGKVGGVQVRIGLLDRQHERAGIMEGVADGDLLLTGVAQGVTPGALVKVVDRSQPATPGAASPAGVAAPESSPCHPAPGTRYPEPGTRN